MTTATPTSPALPVGGYVFDRDPDWHAAPVPPFARIHSAAAGVVVLNVQPTPGTPVYVAVPVGEPVPLPGCPGWTAHCSQAAPPRFAHDYCAVVWLVHDGERRGMVRWDERCEF